MKCPHCDAKISVFSGAVNKSSGGALRSCPTCGKGFKLSVAKGRFVLIFLPLMLLSILLLRESLAWVGMTVAATAAALASWKAELPKNLTPSGTDRP